MNRTSHKLSKTNSLSKIARKQPKRATVAKKSLKTNNKTFSTSKLISKSIVINKKRSLFSTSTSPTSTSDPSSPEIGSSIQSKEQLENDSRVRFKQIVGTMNEEQKLVIQALVAESQSLRKNLSDLNQLADQHQSQFEALSAQIATIKSEGNQVQAQAPAQSETEQDEGLDLQSTQLDLNSPTFLEDLIAIERNPRVKQSLIREKELRESVKPLINIIERAAGEKKLWLNQQKKLAYIVLALSAIIVGQGLHMWTSSAESLPHIIAASSHLHSHLDESVELIEMYQNAFEQPNPKQAAQLPNAKWSILKEKIRLDSIHTQEQ